jgi:DnaJ-class molecular chaperone
MKSIDINADMALEIVCPICTGTGGNKGRYDRWRCHNCNGAGYVPTEFGKMVLALMRHNFYSMLQDTTADD